MVFDRLASPTVGGQPSSASSFRHLQASTHLLAAVLPIPVVSFKSTPRFLVKT